MAHIRLLQGDIVLMPFPFSDLSPNPKKRPAVVISNKLVNKSEDVILAAITSNIRNDEFSFKIHNKDVSHPLPHLSEIRCDKIFTADKGIIIKKISSLNKEKQKSLFDKIAGLLDVN